MGQLVTSSELRQYVEANIRANVRQVTGPYSRLFGGGPTFVAYYSQDLARGSTDTNLGGSTEIVGPEASLRYKRVFDFPLYGIGQLDLTTAYDDVQGSVTGNVQGECHLLPGTLEPYENDLFVVDYLDVKLVFRCRQVDADRIEGRAFFRLQWFLDQTNVLDLAERQITESLQFEIANVGTDLSPLVEKELSLELARLRVVEERLKEAYWKAFYDRSSGTLILWDSTIAPRIHDSSVDLFVSRNNLLATDRYLGSRVVVPADYRDRGQFVDTVYPLTLYWASEEALAWSDVSATVLATVNLTPARPLSPASPFFELGAAQGYTEATPVPGDQGVPYYSVGGPAFVAQINAAGPRNYDRADTFYSPQPMQALAQRCLNGCYRILPAPGGGNARELARQLVEDMNDTALLASRPDFFWLGPIALMEAKHLRRSATTTTN